MWFTEHTHHTSADPAAVFALWADVPNWNRWDSSLIATTLDGPFAAGSTGTIHPDGAPGPIAFTLTEVTPGVGFADATHFGDIQLRFRHTVTPEGSGAAITVLVEAEGPGEASVGPMVADDMPQAVAALAALAEQRTFAT